MRFSKATFIALIAASAFGFTNQALAEVHERAVIVVTVDENGRTIFRCTGIECEIVDCSGNGQLAASGDPFLVRREGQDSCATENADPAATQILDQGVEEIVEIFEEAAIESEPGGEGAAPIVIDTGLTETTEADAAQQTGESSEDTPQSLQP